MNRDDKKRLNHMGIRYYPVLLLLVTIALVFFAWHFTNSRKHKPDPVHCLKSYDFDPSSSVMSRVTAPPKLILNHLKTIDQRDDYISYEPTNSEINSIKWSTENLPPLTRKIIQDRLIGIYLIDNFLGSGLTEWVIDDKNNFYAFIVINSSVLKRTFSQQVTWKENTCFIPDDPELKISVNCGAELNGFYYILLHESVHLVDYVRHETPYVEETVKPLQGKINMEKPFTKGIWKNYNSPVKEFRGRDNITFYGFNSGPKISIREAVTYYKELSTSPFASLYGTMNWAEDIAEFVTFYHITEILNKPYTITVSRKEMLQYELNPMKSALLRDRFASIQRFYE